MYLLHSLTVSVKLEYIGSRQVTYCILYGYVHLFAATKSLAPYGAQNEDVSRG